MDKYIRNEHSFSRAIYIYSILSYKILLCACIPRSLFAKHRKSSEFLHSLLCNYFPFEKVKVQPVRRAWEIEQISSLVRESKRVKPSSSEETNFLITSQNVII